MAVSSVSPLRIVVSNPDVGSLALSGRAGSAVDLTMTRVAENEATLTGRFGYACVCNLKIVRRGDAVTVSGTVGGGPFAPVNLVFTPNGITGNLAGDVGAVRLVCHRGGKATTLLGRIGAYNEKHVGPVELRIFDGEVRSYNGATSLKPEGKVTVHEKIVDGVITTSGSISSGFDGKVAMERSAAGRRLELVDTTLLLILVQAMRRQIDGM